MVDNDKVIASEVDIKNFNSLGMKLISLFSEQLEGDLYFINNNDLEITLNFKAAVYQDAVLNKSSA